MSDVARWTEAIGRLIEELTIAVEAFEAGDREAGRPARDRAQRARARLDRVIGRFSGPEGAHPAIDAVRALDLRWAAAVSQFAGDRSADAVLDADLPSRWDAQVDVVVVSGTDQLPVVVALLIRGHRRVVWLSREPPVSGVVSVANLSELSTALYDFGAVPVPERFVYLQQGVPLIPLPEVKALADGILLSLILDRNTRAEFRESWVRQSIAALPVMGRAASLAVLANGFRGRPFVVVCPGPSLERNVHLLLQLKGRAVICAVSHAARVVVQAGVIPDFVVAVDPQDYAHFFDDVDLTACTAVVFPVSAHPAVLARAQGATLLSFLGSGDDAWVAGVLDEEVVLPSGGSVANTAASLGLLLGCDPVVYVGQDLAYSGGRMYAKATPGSPTYLEPTADGQAVVAQYAARADVGELVTATELLEVPGWDGNPVRTSVSFTQFRKFFETLGRARPDVTFLNCTEGGARIEGIAHLPLAEWMSGLTASFDVREVVAAAVEQAPDRWPATCEDVGKRVGYFDTLADLCARALALQPLASSSAEAAEQFERTQATVWEFLDILLEAAILLQARAPYALAEMRHARTDAEASAVTRELLTEARSLAVDLAAWYREAQVGLTEA